MTRFLSLAAFCSALFLAGCGDPSAEAVDGSSDLLSDGSSLAVCEVASDCKGLLPMYCRVCANGKTACAHFACESGKCKVETCPAAPVIPACKVASDCTGPLPMYCQVCSDGTSACAHHVCVNGQCSTQTCAASP
jgi:hypothetical protein